MTMTDETDETDEIAAKHMAALLAALTAIEPLLDVALKAYQFGASSYTYEAMVACMKATDLAHAAIVEATATAAEDAVIAAPEVQAASDEAG
jgi:hypothetical protein